MSIRKGQTRWICLACGHKYTISERKEHVLMTRCDRCGSPFLEAVRSAPTVVSGAGLNTTADLGLALLMEAQEK